jgi:Ca2+-binding RTX toxin-like protein
MTAHDITTNTIVTGADGIDLDSGDTLFVMSGIQLAGLGSGTYYGVGSGSGDITATIDGSVTGQYAGIQLGAGGDTVLIGAEGSVTGLTNNGISIGAGGNIITNNGEIDAIGDGIAISGSTNTEDNQIVNHGDIVGTFGAVTVSGGQNIVTNTGSLSAGQVALVLTEGGADGDNYVANSGEISGSFYGIDVGGTAGFTDTIVNSGTITGTTQKGIEEDSSSGGSLNITNSGTIEGSTAIVFRATSNDLLANSGTIEGSTIGVKEAAQGWMSISNNAGGTISGTTYAIEFNASSANIDVLQNNGTIRSNNGIAVLENGHGGLNVTNDAQGMIGAASTAIVFNGDATQVDTLDNSGIVSAPISGIAAVEEVGAAEMYIINSGTIAGPWGIYINHSSTDASDTLDNSGTILGGVYEAGSATSLDVTNSGHIFYNVIFSSGTNVYDGTLGSISGEIFSGSGQNDFTGGAGKEAFDLTLGTNTVDGGGGNDVFYLGANLNSSQTIDGGTGNDTVYLTGDYSAGLVLGADTLVNVEKIVLDAGYSYTLTTDDNTVAAGARMIVDASALTSSYALKFDGSAETDGHFTLEGGAGNDYLTGGAGNDVMYGNGGDNRFTGGGGEDKIIATGDSHDRFIYTDVSDSTSTSHDIITGFSATADAFDLDVTVTGINSEVTSGRLSTGNFDANLASAIGAGQLAAGHAVLFTPTVGSLAGHTFLIVDANGVAGYQAGQDYVFDVTGAAHLNLLATSDFI